MPRRPVPPPDTFLDVPFPVLGQNVVTGFQLQPAQTTIAANNCRGFEPTLERNRGGARSGMIKWIPTQVNGTNLIQDLNTIAISQTTIPRGVTIPNTPSGYALLATAIVNGQFRFAVSGDVAPQWYAPTTDSTFWNSGTALIRSAALNQKLWVADGTNWFYWDPSTAPATGGTVTAWTASSGTLPADSAGNAPRLIAAWRGGIIVSGIKLDPNNWFLSAVGDPTNWNFAPTSPSPTQAVAGNTSSLGLVGEPITSVIPYTDDVLVLGAQRSLWMIQGDPRAGGTMQLISSSIGMAFGDAWCMDPTGTIYFFSNQGGVYSLVPGQQPVRISQQIAPLLASGSPSLVNVKMLWNDRAQGCHMFSTPILGATLTNHFFYDLRNKAWWVDQFGNNNLNPIAAIAMEGYTPADRLPLIGSWDGYVRVLSNSAVDDDGTPILSAIFLGPIVTKDFDAVLLKDLQCMLGASSGPVTYNVFTGATAELAGVKANTVGLPPDAQGVWQAGRNLSSLIRRSGHALYVKLFATTPWAFEGLRARVQGQGRVRARAFGQNAAAGPGF